MSMTLYVTCTKPHFQVDWRLLIKERNTNIGLPFVYSGELAGGSILLWLLVLVISERKKQNLKLYLYQQQQQKH